jgi:hypothetical protein
LKIVEKMTVIRKELEKSKSKSKSTTFKDTTIQTSGIDSTSIENNFVSIEKGEDSL